MQVNRGKFHKYIGRTLDYTAVGQVKITMLDYTNELLDNFDKAYPTGDGTKSSATPDIIFKVDEDCKKINAKQAVDFHHLVEKILFSTKRSWMDTCTRISFITISQWQLVQVGPYNEIYQRYKVPTTYTEC